MGRSLLGYQGGWVVLDELDLDSLVKLDLTDQGQGPRMKPS